MNDLHNAQQSADLLGLSAESIHRYRRQGLLTPTFTAGRMHLYSTDALHTLVDQLDEQRRADIEKMRSNLPPRAA